MQVGPLDPRHFLNTLALRETHKEQLGETVVHMHVLEEEAEGLARFLLLMSVMMDEHLAPGASSDIFLALHGDVNLSEEVNAYAGKARGQGWYKLLPCWYNS